MSESSLSGLARRAEDHDHFVASRLAQFRRSQQIGDSGLAEFLECRPDQLIRLAMCVAPTQEDDFSSHIQKIASFAGCNAVQLALLIRQCDAVRIASRSTAEGGVHYSLAARDQKKDDSDNGVSK